MGSLAKTIVATGLSSGLGFEALKQLLEQAQPYKIILGARNTQSTESAIKQTQFDRQANAATVLPLDLSQLKAVKTFAEQTLEKLGQTKLDYLLLNAAISNGAEKPGPNGSKWCESLIVNHLSQHYLVHLLKDKLVDSKSRIVFVSSGAVRNVPDPSVLDEHLKSASGIPGQTIYSETKFTAFLGAQWWRRELLGKCDVLAVSPGLVPGTNLGRGSGFKLTMDMPDAKTVPDGATSVLRALTRTDIPEDPERMFLTSWGEWWEKSVYEKSLDKALQDKWCPSKEEIERDEHIIE